MPRKPPSNPIPVRSRASRSLRSWRDAIAHEEEAPGGKVRMTFRVLLTRQQAEALAAWAIKEEKNIGTLVTEILEAATLRGKA